MVQDLHIIKKKLYQAILKYVDRDLRYFVVFIIKSACIKSNCYFLKIIFLIRSFDLNERLRLFLYNYHLICETQIPRRLLDGK